MMEPIIFVPLGRYTSATNVTVPVILRFLRNAAILMVDWGTLRFIENAPSSVWIATTAIAVLVIAVIESRDWLRFKGRWYFPSFLGVLLVCWISIIGFA